MTAGTGVAAGPAGGFAARTVVSDEVVYQPQADTALLIDALDDVPVAGRRVLDLCTGTGAVAAAAAARGALQLVAVDACPHATAAAQMLRPPSPRWSAVQSTVAAFTDRTGFDLITCNPPYVPTPADGPHDRVPGPAHAWNAGPDGREVLDALCSRAGELVRRNGAVLVVQSALADPERTAEMFSRNSFQVTELRRRTIAFGPVLRSRRAWLVEQGLLDRHQDSETLVVLLAERRPR